MLPVGCPINKFLIDELIAHVFRFYRGQYLWALLGRKKRNSQGVSRIQLVRIRYPLQIVPGTVGDSREPRRRCGEPISVSFCGLW
jgi:hypothetical protein